MRIPDPNLSTQEPLELAKYLIHFCSDEELGPYNSEIYVAILLEREATIERCKYLLDHSFVVVTYFELAKRFTKILYGEDPISFQTLFNAWAILQEEYTWSSINQFEIDMKSALVRQLIRHREIILTLINDRLHDKNMDLSEIMLEKSEYDKEVDELIQKLLF